MEKTCTICKKNKDVSEFNKHPTRKDGLQSACRACNRERSKAYYASNLEHHKRVISERNKQLEKIIRSKVDDYKMNHGCSLCDEKEPVCLDFHHRKDKDELVSRLIAQLSLRRLEKEIAKCSLLCANCHRKLHKGLFSEDRINAMPLCNLIFEKIRVRSFYGEAADF